MIIVKVIGGLGNQMFQYAYAKVLQERGYRVALDITSFDINLAHGGYQLDKYNTDMVLADKGEIARYYKQDFLSRILYRLHLKSKQLTVEKSLLYDEKLLHFENDSLIEGYFQSEKYFMHIRALLLEQFTLKNDLSNYSDDIKNKIKPIIHSCSLHIRRGDYVSNSNTNKVHGTCDLEYYINSMKYIESIYSDVRYFIFSDDIAWVKENLKIDNAIYIDSKESRIPHEDIYLMSLCKHNIIANSSFSWWGAWLNDNDEKVIIAPSRWFATDKLNEQSKDIVCDSWIRL